MSTQFNPETNNAQLTEPSTEDSMIVAEETVDVALQDEELDGVAGGALSFRPALGFTTTNPIPISTG